MNRLSTTIALTLLLTAGPALAQSIQPVYSFGSAAIVPFGGLVQSADGNFYGTLSSAGDSVSVMVACSK